MALGWIALPVALERARGKWVRGVTPLVEI